MPDRNLWLRTFVSGTYGIGGVRVKPFSCTHHLLERQAQLFVRLIVCRLCMSLGVDTTSFLKEERGGSLVNLLKFGSYIVCVRRNCTVGQNFGVTSHSYLRGSTFEGCRPF